MFSVEDERNLEERVNAGVADGIHFLYHNMEWHFLVAKSLQRSGVYVGEDRRKCRKSFHIGRANDHHIGK